jgi:hypothetical protein
LCLFIFETPKSQKPIDVLQRNGYFLRGEKNLLDGDVFSVALFLSLVECFMWAYLDRKLPRREMGKILGKAEGNVQDCEHAVCAWINAVVSKHAQLPVLNVIGQQFFGLPYLRLVLFHFTLEDRLLNTSDTSTKNMEIGFAVAKSLKIPLPFDESKIIQPPLAILCFWCKAIVILSALPPAKRRSPLSDQTVARRLSGLCELRRAVNDAKKRCQVLAAELSSKGDEAQRSRSVMRLLKMRVSDSSTKNDTESEHVNLEQAKNRIKWDPAVLALAKKAHERE